jgi:WD40 repeat protein
LQDIRDPNGSVTFVGKSEVRDVSFSPYYPNYFAGVFENGSIQLWDIRKNNQALQVIQAHHGLVLTLDWHPTNPNALATGGRDRSIKCWDLTAKAAAGPYARIQTIAGVGRVKWKPGPSHVPGTVTPVNHTSTLASCASLMDHKIHIWHVQQPYLPRVTLGNHRDVVTSMEWIRNDTTMISSAKDGNVQIVVLDKDIAVIEPRDNRLTASVAFGTGGADLRDASTLGTDPEDEDHSNMAPRSLSVTVEDLSASTRSNDSTSSSLQSSRDFTLTRGLSNSSVRSDTSDEGSAATTDTSEEDIYIPVQHLPTTAMGWSCHNHLAVVNDAINRNVSVTGDDLFTCPNSVTATKSDSSTNTNSPSSSTAVSGDYTSPLRVKPTVAPVTGVKGMLTVFGVESASAAPTSANNRTLFAETEDADHVLGFDPEVFQFLAENYIFQGESIAECCEHNASMAAQVNRPQLAQVWAMLKLLYGTVEHVPGPINQGPGDYKSSKVSTPALSTRNPRHMVTDQGTKSKRNSLALHSPNPSNVLTPTQGLDNYPLTPSMVLTPVSFSANATPPNESVSDFDDLAQLTSGHESSTPLLPQNLSSVESNKSDLAASLSLLSIMDGNAPSSPANSFAATRDHHEWQEVTRELLTFYADQGDVQTCVTVLLVLNPYRPPDVRGVPTAQPEPLVEIERKIAMQWFYSYIEFLQRLGLWNCANHVIQWSREDSIRSLNQKSTVVATSCANCQKPIPNDRPAWGCDRATCRRVVSPAAPVPAPPVPGSAPGPSPYTAVSTHSLCALCHKPVKGLWVWCQGCGHGGHLSHLIDWFKTERACPTGCSHMCLSDPNFQSLLHQHSGVPKSDSSGELALTPDITVS